MERNKKILIGVGVSVLLIFIILFFVINSAGKNTSLNKTKSGDFVIWTYGEQNSSVNKFFVDGFKKQFPDYKNTKMSFVNFNSYSEYKNILSNSFLDGTFSPDIFVINNNDSKILESGAIGVAESEISIDNFRKKFYPIFKEELIRKDKEKDKDGNETEQIMGIPLGFEPFGIFYNPNTNHLGGKDLTSWLDINKYIGDFYNEGKTLVGFGGGKNVFNVSDIVAQFLLLNNINGVVGLSSNSNIEKILETYIGYGTGNLGNNFDGLFLENASMDNIDKFKNGEVSLIAGFPSLISKISQKGVDRMSIEAASFPTYSRDGKGPQLINYNYFVVNKNINEKNVLIALDYLKYLSSEVGQKEYLKYNSFVIPSIISLNSTAGTNKIFNGYDIKLGSFYNKNATLSSFNKGIKEQFDLILPYIIDNKKLNYRNLDFENFIKSISCMTDMVINKKYNQPCNQ